MGPPTPTTRGDPARMMSTTLDHQKGTKLWVHDATPRTYDYHPFSPHVTGLTPSENPKVGSGRRRDTCNVPNSPGSRRGEESRQVDAGGRQTMETKTVVAGGRAVRAESHTLYHTPYYQNNGMC